MTIALVDHCAFASGGANSSTTGAMNSSGANLIVVAVASYGSGSGLTLADNLSGNIWTPLTMYGGAVTVCTLFYCLNPTVGAGHTFTASGTGVYCGITAAAFSGVATSSAFDQQNGADTTLAATTLATGSVTPSVDDELVITGINANGAGTLSIDSSFAVADSNGYSAGNNFACAIAYLVQTTKGAVDPTWTLGGTETQLAAAIATFKAAAGGGGVFSWANYYYRLVGGMGQGASMGA